MGVEPVLQAVSNDPVTDCHSFPIPIQHWNARSEPGGDGGFPEQVFKLAPDTLIVKPDSLALAAGGNLPANWNGYFPSN